MKDLLKIFTDDFKMEGFTKKDIIAYGIIAPAILIAGCIIGELLNKM